MVEGDVTEVNIWWSIAWPIALSLSSRAALGLTDTAVLGHLGTKFLAGSSLAQIWITLTNSFVYRGMGVALNTLSSQARGAGRLDLIGVWLQISMWVVTLMLVPVAVSWFFVDPLMVAFGFQESEAHYAGIFAKWYVLYLFPQAWFTLIRNNLESQNIVFPSLITNLVLVVANVGINILLVFGAGSWDGLGFIGSPIATAIGRALSLIFIVGWAWGYKQYNQKSGAWTGFDKRALNPKLVWVYLEQAGPLLGSAVLEELQIQVFAMLAAKLAEAQFAAHSSMLQIVMVLASLPFGISKAAAIRIGYHLGNHKDNQATQKARFISKVNSVACVVVGALLGLVIYFGRAGLAHLFASDDNELGRETIAAIESLSHLVAIVIFFACAYFATMGILEGQGRPFYVLLAFIVGMWGVGVTSGALMEAHFKTGHKLQGIWIGLGLGYFVTFLIELVAVYIGDWDAIAAAAQSRALSGELGHGASSKPAALPPAPANGGDEDASAWDGGTLETDLLAPDDLPALAAGEAEPEPSLIRTGSRGSFSMLSAASAMAFTRRLSAASADRRGSAGSLNAHGSAATDDLGVALDSVLRGD